MIALVFEKWTVAGSAVDEVQNYLDIQEKFIDTGETALITVIYVVDLLLVLQWFCCWFFLFFEVLLSLVILLGKLIGRQIAKILVSSCYFVVSQKLHVLSTSNSVMLKQV